MGEYFGIFAEIFAEIFARSLGSCVRTPLSIKKRIWPSFVAEFPWKMAEYVAYLQSDSNAGANNDADISLIGHAQSSTEICGFLGLGGYKYAPIAEYVEYVI